MTSPDEIQFKIPIGRNEFIDCTFPSTQKGHAIQIDEWLEPLDLFLSELETECVARCCGLDAFRFWPEDIRRASSQLVAIELRSKLMAVQDRVRDSDRDLFVSGRLNQYIDREGLLQLLEHFKLNSDSNL